MTRDYLLGIRLRSRLGNFFKFSFWFMFSTLILESIAVLYLVYIDNDLFLSNDIYAIFSVATVIPLFPFVLSVFVYEGAFYSRRVSSLFLGKMIVWVLYHLLPSVLLLYRFDPIISSFQFIFFLPLIVTSSLFLFRGNYESNAVFNALRPFKDVKYVMIDFWRTRDVEIERKHFAVSDQQERTQLYIQRDILDIFQESLTSISIDAEKLADTVNNKLRKGRTGIVSITMLDIGGGEGRFTSLLIELLKKKKIEVSRIVNIEPSDLSEEYKDRISRLLPSKSVYIRKEKFEDYNPKTKENFDFILASHSLYGPIDEGRLDVPDIINRLVSIKAVNGIVAVILANNEGRSYAFKSDAIRTLFGLSVSDADSSKFDHYLAHGYDSYVMDSIIDLTDEIEKYENTDSEVLYKWLSYFLRADFDKLSEYQKLCVVDLLRVYLQPAYELTLQDFNFFQIKTPSEMDRNNSQILMHKTETFIF